MILGGGYLGAGTGFAADCVAGFNSDPNNLGIPAAMDGMSVEAVLATIGGLQVEKSILRSTKSVKIKLSGNNAWEATPIVIPLN